MKNNIEQIAHTGTIRASTVRDFAAKVLEPIVFLCIFCAIKEEKIVKKTNILILDRKEKRKFSAFVMCFLL